MYNYTNCPVCKSQTFSDFLNCEDYTVSHEKFNIVSCDACGFKFTNPLPDIEKLGSYYKSEEYISHSDTTKGLISKLYHLVRKRTIKAKLEIVSSHVSRGTLLDYGCGTGAFLDAARQSGWKTFGLEPDSGARKMAFESGLNVSGDKEVLQQKTRDHKFNAITLWHVLEHVTDLEETLSFFKNKLNREGALIVAVPNHKSFDALHYGNNWAAYDVPRHLYHFDKDSLEKLMSTAGFRLVKMYPMKYDSFYVSMLSEKHKNGSINYLKAFFIGLRSNMKAKQASEYSSVIYVFQ
ncbi:MAG: class I SAM-dependent methyltransferase [bacterium]|nr:class I SAM-dependent methyltransferase [bacterium]